MRELADLVAWLSLQEARYRADGTGAALLLAGAIKVLAVEVVRLGRSPPEAEPVRQRRNAAEFLRRLREQLELR